MTGGPAFRSIVLPAEQLSRKSMRVLIRFEEVYSQGDDEALKKKYWRRWTVKQQSSLRWETWRNWSTGKSGQYDLVKGPIVDIGTWIQQANRWTTARRKNYQEKADTAHA
jgi:hypothetical protein